jgi:uncharacterized phage-associated protein
MKFNDRKAAQVGAYFLRKAGGTLPHMKLMKLMYLANRAQLEKYAQSLYGDSMSSMDYGPILSQTLNLINGTQSSKDGWKHWISDRANYKVKLVREFSKREELDEISNAEIDTLKAIWKQFGKLDQFQLSDYCHENCGEWTHPQGSSTPIAYEDVLRAVGWKKQPAKRAAEDIESQQRLDRALARLQPCSS